jgi:hypothetical protein
MVGWLLMQQYQGYFSLLGLLRQPARLQLEGEPPKGDQ